MSVMRMLWPRIVYWTGIGLTVFGLFYVLTGGTGAYRVAEKATIQTGGGVFALVGVLAMLGAKGWMDAVVRRRNRASCPACKRVVAATRLHCPACGAPQRTTPEMLRVLIKATPSTSCTDCGERAA